MNAIVSLALQIFFCWIKYLGGEKRRLLESGKEKLMKNRKDIKKLVQYNNSILKLKHNYPEIVGLKVE